MTINENLLKALTRSAIAFCLLDATWLAGYWLGAGVTNSMINERSLKATGLYLSIGRKEAIEIFKK